VLALIIITHGGWKLVKTVTAFTVSHSVTLTLATLGYVHIPQRPVEAVIALSIVFVAAEILRGRQGYVGITARAPWLVVLMFGLMHGLGFASGLKDAGLPDGHIPTALLFFIIRVETGHFLFIGFVLSLIALMLRAISRLTPDNQQRLATLEVLPAYAIRCSGLIRKRQALWSQRGQLAKSSPRQRACASGPARRVTRSGSSPTCCTRLGTPFRTVRP
jgi:hypothetical protein